MYARHDTIYFDEKCEEWRQANLNSCAIQKSRSSDFRCNILLFESRMSGFAPLSAIAHYPCKLDCQPSAAIGQAALDLCSELWPLWSIALGELLRSPVLFWADDSWPIDFIDEFCGIALIAGVRVTTSVWRTGLQGFALGTGRTPVGSFPSIVKSIREFSDAVLIEDSTEHFYLFPFNIIGEPWIIEWGLRRIERLPSSSVETIKENFAPSHLNVTLSG